MNHQVIFLNGPPGSGKDTAAGFISQMHLRARHMKFAGELKETDRIVFGISDALWKELEKPGSQTAKDKVRDIFSHKSWREVLIWLSEDAVKPEFGKAFWGNRLLHTMQAATGCNLTVISDSGFEAEAWPIINYYGPENCHIWHLHRQGCTFKDDSRSYIFSNLDLFSPRVAKLHFETINNDHELSMFRVQVLVRLKKITNEPYPTWSDV